MVSVGHRRGGGEVAHAVGAVVDDFAVAGEDGDGAGELFFVDDLLHEGVEALEALRGEADRLGLDGSHIDCGPSGFLRVGGDGGEHSQKEQGEGEPPGRGGFGRDSICKHRISFAR